jgi:hypothetical protein
VFKKNLSLACMEKYKNVGSLIIKEMYYEPPKVDDALYELKNDPYKINRGRLREAYKRRDKELDDMRVDRTSMFTFIVSSLSKESLDEIQGQPSWSKLKVSRDPLELWQGPYKTILDYKHRFDSGLEAFISSRNTVP